MNKYDIQGMKMTAESIDRNLQQFTNKKNKLDEIIQNVQMYWKQDTVADNYVARYRRDLLPDLEQIQEILEKTESFFSQAAVKYSRAQSDASEWLQW